MTFTDGEDTVYDEITINSVEQAAPSVGLAFVTYKKTANKTGGSTTQYTNDIINLTAAAEGSFAAFLSGKLIGNTLTEKKADKNDASKLVDTKMTFEDAEYTYSEITINWVVNSEAVAFTVTPEENPFKSATGTVTATNGTKKTLADAKDGSIVYHIYPVGRQEVPTLTAQNAKMIVTDLFGDTIVADALDCFTKDSGWKYTKKEEGKDDVVRTLYAIIEELVKAYDDLEKAEDNLSKNTDSTKKAELQQKVDEAAAKVNDEALDKVWEEILLCTKEGETKTIAEVMVEEYDQLIYDTLEDEYNEEILDKVTEALWALINDSVKVNSVPKKALKAAYKQNINAYKNEFYTGMHDSTNKITNQKQYGTVRNYLIAQASAVAESVGMTAPASGDYKTACAILEREAELQVEEIVTVWVVMQAMEDAIDELDLSVSNSEINNLVYIQWFYENYFYGNSVTEDELLNGYGKENIRTALAFDKFMSYLTETQAEEKEGETVKVEADASKFLNITVVRDEPKDEEAAEK